MSNEQSKPAGYVPKGWQLVPKMLTSNMRDAIVEGADNRRFESWPANCWEDALAAAPKAETVQTPVYQIYRPADVWEKHWFWVDVDKEEFECLEDTTKGRILYAAAQPVAQDKESEMVEVIYLYRRKGLSYWSTCDADQYMRFQEMPLFEVKIARNDIDYADLEHEVDRLRGQVAELEASPLMAPEEARAGIALQLKEIERLRAENAELKDRVTPGWWQPIETAPRDNKHLLYLARFDEHGDLVELDFDAVWEYLEESWEISHINGYDWCSANGIEEPTHWAYMTAPAQSQNETLDALIDRALLGGEV